MVIDMEGVIVSMRRGNNKYNPRQVIVKIGDNVTKIFHQLIGRKVVWIHPKTGEKFIGKIVKLHGRKRCVIAYFKKQPPCQSIGEKVQII